MYRYKYFYNGVNVSKRDYELIQFIETGSNEFARAYWVYENRKTFSVTKPIIFYASWFNRTLGKIHKKGLLTEIPFVYKIAGGYVWENPGINASKANFECITIQDQTMENVSNFNKIL